MMKNWFLMLCCCLSLGTVTVTRSFAQAPKHTETSDPNAKKVLDKLRDKYKQYASMSAEFALTIENGSAKEEQTGKLAQKANKYRASVGGNEIICDGKTIWMYNKQSNEVQVNDYDPSSTEIMSPERLFKIHESDKEFIYAITDDNSAATSIEFKPTDKNAEFSKVRISIDKAKNDLSSIKVFNKDGARYTLAVKKIAAGTFTDSHFSFDKSKYPGVIVTDLR